MSDTIIPAAPAAEAPKVDSIATPAASQAKLEATGETPTLEQIQEQNPELTKTEAKKKLKQIKIKFDGKESMEDLPFEIDEDNAAGIEYLQKQVQMAKLAGSRSKESADLKKDVESFFKALTTDTKKVLAELGIDPKKFAEDVINQEIEESAKSPEQKEKEKLMAELEEMRAKLKEEEEHKKSAEMNRLQERFALELDQDITSALQSSSKLPKSPYVIKRIADAMILAHKNGYTNAKATDIVPIVEKEILEEIQGMFGAAPEDALEAILGQQNMERLRKKRVQNAKKTVENASSIKTTGNDLKAKEEAEEKRKKLTYREFFGKF